MTEEEQLQAIKKWWAKHGNLITIVFSIILLLVSAVKYWNWHQEKISIQASNTYEQMLYAFSNKDNKSTRSFANQLINEYGNTVYADAARLLIAKLLISHDHLEKAKNLLVTVADKSQMHALKQVAKIRMARLLAAEKNYDLALDELNIVDDSAYMPVINELKGDIYAATGRYQQAVSSYREAITEVRTHGMGNLFLEMKTNELAALTQSKKMDETIRSA